jgi:hypothetical protein
MWRVEFSSEKFLPLLPEDCQVNPGAYGFELAWWLAQALLKRGIVTSYPVSEDWGWLIEHSDSAENEYSIGCSSMAEHGEGYAGKPVRWSIFIRPYLSLGERLKGISRTEQVAALGRHIVAALEDERIAVEQAEA